MSKNIADTRQRPQRTVQATQSTSAAPQQQQQQGSAAAGWSEALHVIMQEVRDEDSSLWPSLSTLLDELMSVLQGLTERSAGPAGGGGAGAATGGAGRYLSVDDRLAIRTALAMAARVKLVCSTSSSARNITSTAGGGGDAARPTAASRNGLNSSFRADMLLDELKRYAAAPAAAPTPAQVPTAASFGPAIANAPQEFRSQSIFSGNNSIAMDKQFHFAGSNDLAAPLQSLASRVKMMESDFADDNIPERHLYLLRDLRMRVLELEKSLSEELLAQRALWESERFALLRKAPESADIVEQLRQGQDESVAVLRQRYEDALRRAEEALESNTKAATQEVARLEVQLAQALQQLQFYQQQQTPRHSSI